MSKKSLFDDFDVIDNENCDDNERDSNKAPLISGEKSSVKNSATFKGSKFKLSLSPSTSSGALTKMLSKDSKDKDYEALKDSDENFESSSGSLRRKSGLTIGKIKVHRRRPANSRRSGCCCCLLQLCKNCTLSLLLCASVFLLVYGLVNGGLDSIFKLPLFASTFLQSKNFNNFFKDASDRVARINSTVVWRQNFPMLTIESALRMVNITGDEHLDVIVPFGTGIDAAYYDSQLCEIYFKETPLEARSVGCGGGVIAVDGKTGEPVWAQYTQHELFASNCNVDINNDGYNDCILAGRMAGLYAVDAKTGNLFWSVDPGMGTPISETSNFYTPLLIPRDIDGDSVPDLLVIHGGDPLRKRHDSIQNIAKIIIISSKTGRILAWNPVPKGAESYYSPQLLIRPDGTPFVLFGTGGETKPGGLYVVDLEACLRTNSPTFQHHVRALFEDASKGVIAPPTLVDLNNDGFLDIVLAHFNGSVRAFDGATFSQLWVRNFPGSETYSSPAVAFFNDDNVPDIAVQFQYGPGFPVYDYAEFEVLDGRNGQSIRAPVRMLIGAQSSPLSAISLAQNDCFLFWFTGCSNSTEDQFQNVLKSASSTDSVFKSSKADFCKMRFGNNSQQFTQYRSLCSASTTILYDSRTDEPKVEQLNYTKIVYEWAQQDETKSSLLSDGGNRYVDDFGDQRRRKRHVGLHNGDQIQRVISTGTLAPPLSLGGDGGGGGGGSSSNGESVGHGQTSQLPLDGSVDVIFATYSFPAATLDTLSSSQSTTKQTAASLEMTKCVQKYMTPEAETELRLAQQPTNDGSMMDHDAYVETIQNFCRQQISTQVQADSRDSPESEEDRLRKLIRPLGSLTLHRINLKAFDEQRQQIGFKQYRYQWWPAYLGINGDSVSNIVE